MLGHKANHSFRPNTELVWFRVHPVMGEIYALRAMKNLPAGSEVYINYNYPNENYEALNITLARTKCEKVHI